MSIQTQIDRINQSVDTQATLMAQLKTALEGKGSSGGGSGEKKSCLLNIEGVAVSKWCCVKVIDGEDFFTGGLNMEPSPFAMGSVKCGSMVYVLFRNSILQVQVSENLQYNWDVTETGRKAMCIYVGENATDEFVTVVED